MQLSLVITYCHHSSYHIRLGAIASGIAREQSGQSPLVRLDSHKIIVGSVVHAGELN